MSTRRNPFQRRSDYKLSRMCRLSVAAFLLGVVAFWADRSLGQDFQQYRPVPLPAGSAATELPPVPAIATGDDRPLIDNLRGLLILDNESKLQQGRVDGIDGIQIDGSGLSLLRRASFTRLVQKYLGCPVSMRSLNELTRDIILYYRRCGRPVVDVSVPPQNITGGVVQIVVLEARVGSIRFEGNCYFNDRSLARGIETTPGCKIFEPTLMEDLRWLALSPYRDVTLELTHGISHGQTDVVFNIHEKNIMRGYVGFEDSGVETTGWERLIIGATWGNAFGLDHQASYQYTTSGDYRSLRAHAGTYLIPLADRTNLTFSGGFVDIESILDPHITQRGKAWQASFRLNRYITLTDRTERRLTAGFDFKQTNTNLEFNGVLVAPTPADIAQMVFGYHTIHRRRCSTFAWGADLFISPGGFSPYNYTPNFQQIRGFSSAEYIYGRLYAELNRQLSCRGSSLFARFTGQATGTNLLGSEQLGFGGWDSIRGYDMRQVNGDGGLILNLELRSRPVSLGLANRWCKRDLLVGHLFCDMGAALVHRQIPGLINDENLCSAGLGCRYQLAENVSMRFDYGWQLRDVPGDTRRSRPHVGIIAIY